MFKPLKMTERIRKVREIYKNCPVPTQKRQMYYSGDRWLSLGFLEGWLKNEQALTTKLRRSLAEAYELDCSEPVIFDHELICGQLYFPVYEGEEKERFEALSQAFHMSPTANKTEVARPRADHICLDYEKLLKVGINGVLEEIKQKKRELVFGNKESLYDFDTFEKNEFYDCCIIELEAVLRLAKRYSEHAYELAKKAQEPRKSELVRMAENLEKVPAGPAQNFYEAVQSVHFYTYNMFGLYPMGRPDRYLLPYYEKDMKEGVLTKEFAQELIDNLCLEVCTYVFSRAACGFIVGGSDENGKLVENDLTYMFLTALEHIKMPVPNGAIAVNSMTSRECLEYVTEVLGQGTTHPAIYNDEAIIKGLESYGVPKADACNFIHTTCAEISVCGKSRMYTTSTTFSMPQILLDVCEEKLSGENDIPSFEELCDFYFEKLTKLIETSNRNYTLRILEASRNGYQPIRASCFVDDCIKKGTDVYSGGAKYSCVQPIFVGFANLCDSLFAIKRMVYDDKKLTLKSFYDIVKNDYENEEALRQYIINKLPHYGNDCDDIDSFAHGLMKRLGDIFDNENICAARQCMPGTFSYINHALRGRASGATFDGRNAGKSFADGCCPVQGLDRSGPGALINSLTGWDQSRFMGGMVINLKFTKSMFDDTKKSVFLGVVDAFIKRGGVEMQVNCVDRETLEDALIHPEDHADLIVRIGGYSDYFVKQNPCMQREIIERTQY